ncbi:hypothetical protein OIO90_002753 [Microbotryomycetes sp. JL221]|nr:hypothetical protein OIO90_002753 [Microbotryomycetes sp. JL221]
MSNSDSDDLPTPDELAAALRSRQRDTTMADISVKTFSNRKNASSLHCAAQASNSMDMPKDLRPAMSLPHSTLAAGGHQDLFAAQKTTTTFIEKTKTPARARNSLDSAPTSSARREIALAQELFGSPAQAATSTPSIPLRTLSSNHYGQTTSKKEVLPAKNRRSSPRDGRRVSKAETVISDSEDERVEIVNRMVSAVSESREAHFKSPMPFDSSWGLEDLRIRGEGQSPTQELGRETGRSLPQQSVIQRPKDLKKPLTFSQVIAADDSDDSDEEIRPNFTRTPRVVDNAQRGAEFEADEDFINDGVLTYEPTPRARRPIKYVSPLPVSLVSTPTTIQRRTKNSSRRQFVEIDLTLSSDDDEEYEHTDSESLIPSRTTMEQSPPPVDLARPLLPEFINAPTPSRSKKQHTASSSKVKPQTLTAAQRETLPLELIKSLDRAVFRKSWSGLKCLDSPEEFTGPGLPEGLSVNWNTRLRNTAGRASWKTVKNSDGTKKHVTSVELATKVTDTADKLKHTLSHELCHVAAWVLSGEVKPPHGDAFKLWGKRIMSVRPDISITTTHSYEITYKYRWQCVDAKCGKIFSRHSRSVDTTTHGCPCGSKLVEIDASGKAKAPRAITTERTQIGTPTKKLSEWQEFLATESPIVRQETPGIKSEDVFKVVAERWRAVKEAREANEDPTPRLVDNMRKLEIA